MEEFGYAGKILRVDLSNQKVSVLNTSDYTGRFLGGKGIATKIYWDETGPDTNYTDPENCLVFMTGPLAGFTGLAGSRLVVCGSSPLMDPELFTYANLGGSWGAWLKFAGYDGLVITGQAEHPAYLFIGGGETTRILDASHLWGKTTLDTEEILKAEHGKDARILEIGPAAEKLVTFSTIYAAENSSASGGLGATMGVKKLKAIVIRADNKKRPVAADPDALKSLTNRIHALQVKNWEDYAHETWLLGKTSACYGCINGCTRHTYTAENNQKFRSFCQASSFYMDETFRYYRDNSRDFRLATRLCDKYGLDTMVMQPAVKWLERCYREGATNDAVTGLPVSRIGSPEFIAELVRQIYKREGFGDILARGLLKAAEYLGPDCEKLLYPEIETSGGEQLDYDPRMLLINALPLATEPRRPVQQLHGVAYPYIKWLNWHDGYEDAGLTSDILKEIAESYWGNLEAMDFNTYTGKAMAAKSIQDYNTFKECLILCDMVWPIYLIHLRDAALQAGTLESQLVKVVTGRDMDESGLFTVGERVFNMQRAILIRQGWIGREDDTILPFFFNEPLRKVFYSEECLVPDKNGNFVTRKDVVVERNQFEKMKDEYYSLRGWDQKTGLQTKAELKRLELDEISDGLEKLDLVIGK
jgi:aldehyde:ferredoxin oxidoreductase